ILYFALSKRMTVEAPTCDRHPGDWLRRQLFMYVPLGVFFALTVGGFVYWMAQPNKADFYESGAPCYPAGLLFLFWLVVAAQLQQGMIRAREITDGSITLMKVHERFAAALKALRDRDELEDDDLELRPRRPPQPEERDTRDTYRAERDPGEH